MAWKIAVSTRNIITMRPVLDEAEYGAVTRGTTLAEQVFKQLAVAISAGAHSPRERINIRRLADEMGASVTPVREAVLRLIADGVLELTDKNAIVIPERSRSEIRETFEIRRFLEGGMTAVAAPRLTDRDINHLQAINDKFVTALEEKDYRKTLRMNWDFHFLIYRRADLPLHLKFVETLWLRIGPTLSYMYPLLHRKRSDHGRHDVIIAAAERRDPEELRAAMLADLNFSEKALHIYLGEHSAGLKVGA